MFCYIDSLSISIWQANLETLRQMLESQQSKAAGLQMAAVVAIGRLLMHEAQVCSELGQTEQLVALLVQTYVQPDQAQRGKLYVTPIRETCFGESSFSKIIHNIIEIYLPVLLTSLSVHMTAVALFWCSNEYHSHYLCSCTK